jgi:hypothetical protein
MKFFQIFFCTLLCFLLVQANYAQIGKIFDRQSTKINNAGKNLGNVPKNTAKRVGNNATNRINSGIDRKVDRTIDKVLNPRIQRGSQKGTIKIKNADGSTAERQMTKAEKKALKKQDRADKQKAKKAKRDMIKYGSTDEDIEAELAAEEEKMAVERNQKKQEELRKNITAQYTGVSTFRLVRRNTNNKLDTFFVNSYVNGTRTAIKVREQYNKDKLIHWCVSDRGRMQTDDLQSQKQKLPLSAYVQRDDKKNNNPEDDTIDTLYKLGSKDFNNFKFQREYKMQTRDSVICAHYLGSDQQFEIEVWADESVKARHFEQFVIDEKYVKSPIIQSIALLGKINVQIREAIVTDKNTNEVFYFTYQSSNSNAPSSSHFKSEEINENVDIDGYFDSGTFEAELDDIIKIFEEEEEAAEDAKLDKEEAEREAALRKTAEWFKDQAKGIIFSVNYIINPDK